jgi:hypothetical protein
MSGDFADLIDIHSSKKYFFLNFFSWQQQLIRHHLLTAPALYAFINLSLPSIDLSITYAATGLSV